MVAQEYPVSVVCEVVDCARSSYYHRPMALPEQGLQQAIEAVAATWPRYGYRRITHQLRREGWTVNHKHVARIMRERGLQVHRKPKRRTTTDSCHAFPRYPNLVEQLEIVRPVHYTPEIHHSDQGVQYAATAYTARLQATGVQISMAEVGAAWQNGYAERLMRTIKEEEVDLSDYQDYADAMRQIGRFLDEVYLHKRIHSSLGYLTPAEFESQWRQEQSAQPDMN